MMTASSVTLPLAVALAIMITSLPAEAQTCSGAKPFSSGRFRVGVGAGSSSSGFGSADGQPAFGVQLAFGAAQGLFASVGRSIALYTGDTNRFVRQGWVATTADDAGAGIVTVAGGYGVSVSKGNDRIVEFCPIVGFSRQTGPGLWRECSSSDFGRSKTCSGRADGSAHSFWLGGNIGGGMTSAPRFAFVPFAGGAYVRSRFTANGRSATDDYFEITAGVGLAFRRLLIRPTMSVPMGFEGGGKRAGIEFTFNFSPRT